MGDWAQIATTFRKVVGGELGSDHQRREERGGGLGSEEREDRIRVEGD